MLHKIDAEIGVKEPPGHNNTANNDPGFCSPYERNTQKRGLFSFNPSSESNYDKFPHFQRNILSGLDFNQLNKWLKSHKKDMSCLQKWRTWTVEWTVSITHGPLIQKKQMRERTTYSQACLFSRPFKGLACLCIACLCYCFEMHLLSSAVFWLASTFEERCMTILKTTAKETTFFHACPKHKETVLKRPVRL